MISDVSTKDFLVAQWSRKIKSIGGEQTLDMGLVISYAYMCISCYACVHVICRC